MLKIRAYRILIAFGSVLTILSLTFLYANANNFWLDFPKGYDIYAHLTTMRYYMTHWPHIDWNYQWAAGMPRIYTYPPLPYMVTILVVCLSSLPLEVGTQILLFGSYFLSALATYALVTKITGRRTAGFLSTFVLLASGVVWSWATILGLYPRVVSTPLIPLVAWSTVTYLHNLSRRAAIGTSLVLAMALCSHFLTGLLASITVVVLLLFGGRGIRERIISMARIFLPAGFLGAFVYIPLFLQAAPTSRFLRLRYLQQAPLAELLRKFVWPSSTGSLFPAFALVVIVLIMATTRDVLSDRMMRRYFFAFVALSTLFLVYLFGIYIGVPPEVYINGVPHWEGMYFLAYSASVAFGIMLSKVGLYQPSRKRRIVGIAVVAFLISLGIAQLNPSILYPSYRELFSDRHQAESVVRAMLPTRAEPSHRFGTEHAGIAIWFNYEYPIPQVHDYFAQGILIPDWRYWLDVAVWGYEGNDQETQYLMDWFSIKWFIVGPPHNNYQKFSARPDLYRSTSADEGFSGFEFLAPAPILSTSNQPSALVIARRYNYNNIFQALSHSNFNSQHVIPLRGKEHIDDYTPDELSQFDLVVLYGFDYRDQGKAFDLLADYVRGGGRLIVEVNGSPLDNASSIPEPIPVSRTTATNYGTEWGFTSADHEILEDIDLSVFGPAIYDDGPWGVSSTEEIDIRHWAQPILWTNGHPVLVAGQYGEGRVIWTGMNLFYHINAYRNEEESRFLAQMIEWVAGEGGAQPDYEAHFIHPQRQEVKVLSPAKGVLFKESFFPNWHAHVEGRELKIYRAGPDFMYVALPKDTPYPIEVTLEYKKSNLEWISLGISLVTLVGLAAYAIKRCP